jgi:xylulokinase
MSERYLLSIDLGTSGTKVAIFGKDGNIVSMSKLDYRFKHVNIGWSELDPEEVWQKTASQVRWCVSQSNLNPRQIVALGLSVLGETSMPVDGEGNPVYPAIESIDKRDNAYESYVAFLQKRFGAEEIFKRTSYPLSYLTPVTKLLWLRDHRPSVFSRMRKLVTFQDFMIWRLTGSPAIDYSMASRTMLFDVTKKSWIDEYLELIGITRDFFSPAVESSQPVDTIREEAARQFGLYPSTLVIPGASDQSCAALGAGVLREGLAYNGTGSAEAIGIVTKTPITSTEMLRCGHGSQCYILPDLYLALGFHITAGNLIRWYHDQMFCRHKQETLTEEQNAYDVITKEADSSPPGARGLLLLPHWSGAGTGRIPALNPNSRGAILGLTLSHTVADLSRAIFEGINYETRLIIESLESLGVRIEELVVTGVGAKSPFWLQLKADICGRRVVVPWVTESSLFGAAILAGVGAGIYPSLEEAVDRLSRRRAVFEPDPAVESIYQSRFTIYRQLYDALIRLSEQMASLQYSADSAC